MLNIIYVFTKNGIIIIQAYLFIYGRPKNNKQKIN